jgi:SAM-dependent methyltransferase
MTPRHARGMARMQAQGGGHIGKAAVAVTPVLGAGMAGALQEIRAVVKTCALCQARRQKRRLIVAPPDQAQPVQRDGCDQHAGPDDGPGDTMQPCRGRMDEIEPVAMFQREHHMARVILVDQCRAALRPGACDGQAIIAVFGLAGILARQRHAALITDEPANERRGPPARPAQTEIGGDAGITGQALRGIDQLDCDLQFRHLRPIVCAMQQQPPILTDRPALTRQRARARAMFLQSEALTEVQERLIEVNRTFTAPAVVTGFPEIWADAMPDAVIVPDDAVLDLAPGGHDLVIHALCLHWADDAVGQMVQCRRALHPDGLFIGIMFGGQTLHELRSALAMAEAEVTGGLSPRVLPMGEIRDLGGLLQRAGFALPVADSFTRRVIYRDAWHLMRDLRAMGEGNALAARLRRPTRAAVLTRAAAIYQDSHAGPDGRIAATFDFICLTGWAPADSQQKPLRPGSAAQRLADALGAPEVPLTRG